VHAKTLRIATLVVPSILAAQVMTSAHEPILRIAGPTLALLWMVMAGALVMRVLEVPRTVRESSPWDQLDILTPVGVSTMWMAALALAAARITGWASLSVLGLLGLGTVYLTVIWTAIFAGGPRPWRRATITRAICPQTSVEGDSLREELGVKGVKIVAGIRLFATGRAMRHGVVSRYVIDSDGSGADLKLESDLGSALRGEHRAEPLAMWLGDVLGLTHTPAVYRGEATFSVMPRLASVDGARSLLGTGGDDATSLPTYQLPTEGTFRIREYVPGDDTRRIHWVRSLQQDELVVRLPDEIPAAEPSVRLILDTELYGTESLTCRAVDDLLDALVRVWLGIGKALTETGTRVTLVTAADKNGAIARVERAMIARSSREGLRLGARVTWQTALPLETLVRKAATRQVVVSSRPRRVACSSEIVWVVVPEAAWTASEPPYPANPAITLPFPSGSADNGSGRRKRERRRIEVMWQDRAVFSQIICWSDFSGDYVARPQAGRIGLAVIP
jgi:uncharacterized protein (DUF58 family)